MEEGGKILVHCDLDAFYASVETLHRGLNPEVPLIIGADPKAGRGRGIVSTCNYAARAYGVRSAMPISEAWRRCPATPAGPATYVRGSHRLYARASRRVMNVLRNVGGPFEQASIDEAYLDVTVATEGDWDQALALCERLQRDIVEATGLTASFGLGPTRLLAKMSSEENKPQGLFRLLPGDAVEFFHGRSLREIPGIGPATATAMQEWGVQTVDEAYELGELALARMVGDRFAAWLTAVVEERTSDDVSVLRSRKSIGKETTFERDQRDEESVLEHLLDLVEAVMARAAELGVVGRLGEVKLRYQGFDTRTHRRSIPVAMDDPAVFRSLAARLFATSIERERPVRLVGFRLGDLEDPPTRQVTLERFEDASGQAMHDREDRSEGFE
ncbi:MAG TPA: DNA polymerase IV [Candidatus Poseidoniaceae archaeon]|nr:MAG TPA: DNA polymerase IV [Candidatus Poseidoniales archaeon]HIH53150.1 DNA polymerase IV [Candidatus Poseidoniaceae archaeon]